MKIAPSALGDSFIVSQLASPSTISTMDEGSRPQETTAPSSSNPNRSPQTSSSSNPAISPETAALIYKAIRINTIMDIQASIYDATIGHRTGMPIPEPEVTKQNEMRRRRSAEEQKQFVHQRRDQLSNLGPQELRRIVEGRFYAGGGPGEES